MSGNNAVLCKTSAVALGIFHLTSLFCLESSFVLQEINGHIRAFHRHGSADAEALVALEDFSLLSTSTYFTPFTPDT
jgi:hypothetical protein